MCVCFFFLKKKIRKKKSNKIVCLQEAQHEQDAMKKESLNHDDPTHTFKNKKLNIILLEKKTKQK